MAGSNGAVHPNISLGGLYSDPASIAAAAITAIIKSGFYAFSTEILLAIRWGIGFLAFLAVCLMQRHVPPFKTSHSWS